MSRELSGANGSDTKYKGRMSLRKHLGNRNLLFNVHGGFNFKQQTFMDKRQLGTGIYIKLVKWMWDICYYSHESIYIFPQMTMKVSMSSTTDFVSYN